MKSGIFSSQLYNSLKLDGIFIPLLGKPLSRILAVNTLDSYYQRSLQSPGNNFSEQILNALNVTLKYKDQDLVNIPKEGSAVVVANHPFGGIEGVLISALLEKIRPDVKIMANFLLKSIPELRERFIFVDPFEKDQSGKRNIGPMREAIRWVKSGGLLVVFPAGAVSHFQLKKQTVADPPWKKNIGKLIAALNVAVTPMFFAGQNNATFQILGFIHPGLRTARLPYEFVNKQNQQFNIYIGKNTPVSKLKQYPDTNDLLSYLRKRTYNLANRSQSDAITNSTASQNFMPVTAPFPFQVIEDEISQLPKPQFLFEQKNKTVFFAHSNQIPTLMKEIGRQRENTFREVQEGSGKALDIDQYDDYYIHLIAWDKNVSKLVGAYRLGLVDRILSEFGPQGLYTSSLFKIKRSYFNSISPAIELGRSFIASEYQRSFSSLFLLWRGIGTFISLHPHYRYLFGPVSISNAYQPYSQKMMLEYLKTQHGDTKLSKMVSAKNPDFSFEKNNYLNKEDISYLSELEDLINDLEPNISGIPVLIRQYLKLGAKFISFNRDKDFSSVLDGLIVVDLMQTESKLITKYFGQNGARFYKEYHNFRNNI